jgi:GAF domain-containing protein
MRALYETANDLTAIRDVDAILSAIVRRARQLLQADMTYLSLNDEAEGASYMKVTEGALTPEFKQLRLPLGTGLLGLVAQTGEPYFTEDYQSDDRFVHRGYIDEAVAGEGIRAILGVPLVLEGRVIGTLLAVHRSVRPFPPHEVTLLTSFAAHAAVALENAQLFADLDDAHRTMTQHTAAVEAAALAHDRLTDLLVAGGGVDEVAHVLAEVMGGPLAVLGPEGEHLAGAEVAGDWSDAARESVASGRTVRRERHYVGSSSTPVAGSSTSRRVAPSSAGRWSPRW